MLPDTGEVIRPLLGFSRADIEEYLRAIGQDFVTDSSNLSSDYRRNFLRNEVIPLLETRWPEARRSICRSAANLLQEERVLDHTAAMFEPTPETHSPLPTSNEARTRSGSSRGS